MDRSAYEDELRNREIKQVTEFEILEKAKEIGADIASKSQLELSANLKRVVQTEGISSAIEYCNINAYPLLDSLEKSYDVSIKRVSYRNRNPKNQPDSLENALLESYAYSLKDEISINDNVQKVSQDELLFTRPIIVSSGLCLNCHGNEGNGMNEEVLNKLDELYPEDKARNHELGDLRGMWSIRMRTKDVVLSIQ